MSWYPYPRGAGAAYNGRKINYKALSPAKKKLYQEFKAYYGTFSTWDADVWAEWNAAAKMTADEKRARKSIKSRQARTSRKSSKSRSSSKSTRRRDSKGRFLKSGSKTKSAGTRSTRKSRGRKGSKPTMVGRVEKRAIRTKFRKQYGKDWSKNKTAYNKYLKEIAL